MIWQKELSNLRLIIQDYDVVCFCFVQINHLIIYILQYLTYFSFQGFLIAVAYSSGIGGLTTLVGTGPNIFVKGFVDQ